MIDHTLAQMFDIVLCKNLKFQSMLAKYYIILVGLQTSPRGFGTKRLYCKWVCKVYEKDAPNGDFPGPVDHLHCLRWILRVLLHSPPADYDTALFQVSMKPCWAITLDLRAPNASSLGMGRGLWLRSLKTKQNRKMDVIKSRYLAF